MLDEPVSALDVSTQNQIINLLCERRDEFGVADLIIVHDLALIGAGDQGKKLVARRGENIGLDLPAPVLLSRRHRPVRQVAGSCPEGRRRGAHARMLDACLRKDVVAKAWLAGLPA